MSIKCGHHNPQEGCHHCFYRVMSERDEAVAALERLEGVDSRMMGINTTIGNMFKWVQGQRDEAQAVARFLNRLVRDDEKEDNPIVAAVFAKNPWLFEEGDKR